MLCDFLLFVMCIEDADVVSYMIWHRNLVPGTFIQNNPRFIHEMQEFSFSLIKLFVDERFK